MARAATALAASVLFASCLSLAVAWGDVRECPLYPEHQPFKEPQVTRDNKVTISVETIKLCSPTSARFWYSRAYACKSCEDTTASIPGVTIITQPGEDLYLTIENNLENPSPTPDEVKAKHTKDYYFADPTMKKMIEHVKNLGYINQTSFHPHGLHTSPEESHKVDGVTYLPDTVFTEILPGGKSNYYFPIRKDHLGGTHLYHPHHHHTTSVQTGGGMHGALLVEDPKGSIPKEIEDMPTKVVVISLVDMRGIFRDSLAGMGMLEQMALGNLWKNLDGPDKGKYIEEDSIFALVNGMWRPQLELTTGHWYRFKMVFAAVEMFVEAKMDSTSGLVCELQLLAKDGIWLHVAPRKIESIYLASGSRADVAIKCECTKGTQCDGALYALNTDPTYQDLKASQLAIDANIHPSKGLETDILTQELISFKFTRPSTGFPMGPISQFQVTRPCYLVDLRGVDVPTNRQARVDFWSPMDDPTSGWKVTWSDWFNSFKGQQMTHMSAPPLFTLTVGDVWQLYVRGPRVKYGGIAQHPLHLHTIPYQITSLVTMDPYFEVGDWHDTLMHAAGQVVVRLHTDTYTGRYIIHCHILTHEDYGMMSYFDVSGKDGTIWTGAEKVDPTCYRQHNAKPGYTKPGQLARDAEKLPETPHWVKGPPGRDCHTACVNYGGCNGLGWPKSSLEFTKILTETGSRCTIPFVSRKSAHNPSYSTSGECNWDFAPYFTSQSVADGNYRCGKTPPFNVARYCPCNKAPPHKSWFI